MKDRHNQHLSIYILVPSSRFSIWITGDFVLCCHVTTVTFITITTSDLIRGFDAMVKSSICTKGVETLMTNQCIVIRRDTAAPCKTLTVSLTAAFHLSHFNVTGEWQTLEARAHVG